MLPRTHLFRLPISALAVKRTMTSETKKLPTSLVWPDLIKMVGENTGINKKDVRAVLTEFASVVRYEVLGKKFSVRIPKLGTFKIRNRESRMCRNPRTGRLCKFKTKITNICKYILFFMFLQTGEPMRASASSKLAFECSRINFLKKGEHVEIKSKAETVGEEETKIIVAKKTKKSKQSDADAIF